MSTWSAPISSCSAVDDEKLGRSQATFNEIVEDRAPGLGALPAHALDREEHLLAVRAYAEDDKERDRSRLAVEPDANDGAVENEPHDRLGGERTGIPGVPVALHLAPRSAHRVLADRAAEHRRQCPAHPARIGASEVAPCDQGVGGKCPTLIGP
jgi:hypothetical protein